LTARLIDFVKSLEGVAFRGSWRNRLSNTVAFTVAGCDSITLLAGLDMEGICASSGSACSAGSLEPSHVMSAMGVDKNSANSLVRFSLGRDSTLAEVQTAEAVLKNVINRVLRR
jgi:cysteine desulfurase